MQAHRAATALKVVGAIVVAAIVAGLLMPAVCRVRQAAARSTCSNNLRQLGMAVHNYADSNLDRLPPGTVTGTLLPVDQRLSFNVLLLPYIECSNVYSELAQVEVWDSPRNDAAVANYRTKLFRCPEWVEESWKPTAPQSELPWDRHSPTNYVGVAGVGLDAGSLPLEDSRIGMLGYERQLKIEEVKDGLANTILLLESGRDPGPWIRGGAGTLRGIDTGDLPITGENRQFGGMHRSSSFSLLPRRPIGANVLLGDVSVRYVKDDIEPRVLAGLATAAGGEAVAADW